MGRYFWQEVVVEARHARVTHYGKTGSIEATTVDDAKAELDRVKPAGDARSGPCCRILEGETVLASRFIDRETGEAQWSLTPETPPA